MNVSALLLDTPSDNNPRRRAGTATPGGTGGAVGAPHSSPTNQTPPERDWRTSSTGGPPRHLPSPVDARGQHQYRPASSPEMAYHQHPSASKPQSPSTAHGNNPIHTTNTSSSPSIHAQRQQQQHQQHLQQQHRSRRSSAASEIAAATKSVPASPAMGSLRPSATNGPGGSNVHHGFGGGNGDGPGAVGSWPQSGPGYGGLPPMVISAGGPGERGSGILRDHHQPPPHHQQQLQGPGVVSEPPPSSSADRQHSYHQHPTILHRDQQSQHIDAALGHRQGPLGGPDLSPQLQRQQRRKTISSGAGSMAPPAPLAGPGTGTPPDEIPLPPQKPTIAALSNPSPVHPMSLVERDRDRHDRGEPYLPPPPVPRGRDPMREHQQLRDRERDLDRDRDAHHIRSAPASSASTPRPHASSGLPPPPSTGSRSDPLGPPGSGRVTPIDIERERERERDQGLRDRERERSSYGPPPPSHPSATSPTNPHHPGASPTYFGHGLRQPSGVQGTSRTIPRSAFLQGEIHTPFSEYHRDVERERPSPREPKETFDTSDAAYLARHERYSRWEEEHKEKRDRDRELRRQRERERERDHFFPSDPQFVGIASSRDDRVERRDLRDPRDARNDPRDIRDPYGPQHRERERERERDFRSGPLPPSHGLPPPSSAVHPPMTRSHVLPGPHMSYSSSLAPGLPPPSTDRDARERDREMLIRERERERDPREREREREREWAEQREHMLRQERERDHERRKMEYREREREVQERELADQEKRERDRANERAREREFWEKREKERKMKEQEARERELTERLNREREAREREIKEREMQRRREMERRDRDRAPDAEMLDQGRAIVGPGVPPMSSVSGTMNTMPVGGSVMTPGLPGGPSPHPPQSHHQGRFNTAFIHTNSVGNSRVNSPIPNPPGGTTGVILPNQMATTIAGPGVPGGMIVGPGISGPSSSVGGMNIIPGGMLGGGLSHSGPGDKRESKRELSKEVPREGKKGSNAPTPAPKDHRDPHIQREKEREREREQQREMYAAAIAGGPSIVPSNANAPIGASGQQKKLEPEQHRVHSRQSSLSQQQQQRRAYPYPEEIGGHGQQHHSQSQQQHGITVINSQPPPGQDIEMGYAYQHGHGPAWERQQREQQQREQQMAMEHGFHGHPYPPGPHVHYGPPPPGFPGGSGAPHPMGGHHQPHMQPQPYPPPQHAIPAPLWEERNGVGIIGGDPHHQLVPTGGSYPQPLPANPQVTQAMALQQAQLQPVVNGADNGPLGFVGMREIYDNSADYVVRPSLQSRACVNLGTFVYPDIPFPHKFDLGGGLSQIIKFREEAAKEKKEKEEKEREEKEREDKAKAKVAAEEKAKELAKSKDQEEGEIVQDTEKEKPAEMKKPEPSDGIVASPSEPTNQVQPLTELQALNEASSTLKPISVDMETRLTIIIPSGHIPDEKPRRPKIWGGGIFPPTNGDATWPRPRENKFPEPQAESLSPEQRKQAAVLRHKSELEVMQRYRARRIYTDDSDLFLCCLHSGWLSWKGAKRAKRKGRDLKVEVRVLRVAGLRNASGKDNDAPIVIVNVPASMQNAKTSQNSRKEEVVVRFLGGIGERCGISRNAQGLTEAEDLALAASGEPPSNITAGKRRREEDDTDEEDDGEGEDKHDGRSLLSSGWGNTHDGAAIEILNALFVERGVSSGRRNRSQRLREYSERRIAVMGGHCPNPSGHGAITLTPYNCTPSFTTGRLAGLKRRRPVWDPHPPVKSKMPNATVLDIIREVEEEEEKELEARQSKRRRLFGPPQESMEDQKEGALMNLRTVVFTTSTQSSDASMDDIPTSPVSVNPPASIDGGLKVRVGHKYTPSGLDKLLFPHDAAKKAAANQASPLPVPSELYASLVARPVILETPKERYLFAPSILAPESSDSTSRMYDISIILETEVTIVDEDPVQKDDDILGDLATVPAPLSTEQHIAVEEPAIVVQAPPAPASIQEPIAETTSKTAHDDKGSGAVPTNKDNKSPAPAPAALRSEDDKEEGEVSEDGDAEVHVVRRGGDKDGDVEMNQSSVDIPAEPSVLLTPSVPREHTTPRPELALTIPGSGSQPAISRSTSVSKSPRPDQQPIVVSEAEQEEEDELGPDDSFITLAKGEDENGNEKSFHYPVQLLQRGITRDMLRFELDGVYVKDVSDKPGLELPEWRIQVINWKWAGA